MVGTGLGGRGCIGAHGDGTFSEADPGGHAADQGVGSGDPGVGTGLGAVGCGVAPVGLSEGVLEATDDSGAGQSAGETVDGCGWIGALGEQVCGPPGEPVGLALVGIAGLGDARTAAAEHRVV